MSFISEASASVIGFRCLTIAPQVNRKRSKSRMVRSGSSIRPELESVTMKAITREWKFPACNFRIGHLWKNVDSHDWSHKEHVSIRRFNKGVSLDGKPWKSGQWGIVPGSHIEIQADDDRQPSYACEIVRFYHAVASSSNQDILFARVRPYPIIDTDKCSVSSFNYNGPAPVIPNAQFIIFASFHRQVVCGPDPSDPTGNARCCIPISSNTTNIE